MKVILFVIISFFTLFSSIAQIKNGKIEYGVTIEMIDGFKGGILEKPYTESMNNAKYLSFSLLFDKEYAVFSSNEGLGVGNGDGFMSKVSAGYMNEVFQNKDFSLTTVYKIYGDYLLKTEVIKDWSLVNESKEIEGFLCYKATSTKVVVNSKGTFQFPIIAWYCPKIPFSFGPNGYGNLPGLILELQVRNVVYGAKKIDLNLKKTPVLSKPKDYPVITNEQFEEIIKTEKGEENFKRGFVTPTDKF
ncbi:GLPGLI family protein [Flavobacterium aquidurense]|uniref:GLPGLI family protein n=1 Tax=Flavobacterium aquidurense TaxID=362413 RepID=UPI0010407B8B